MFNWFRKLLDCPETGWVDSDEMEKQRYEEFKSNFMFEEEEGVSCLVDNIEQSVIHSFDEWEFDCSLSAKKDDIKIYITKDYFDYPRDIYFFRGSIVIEGVVFIPNHNSLERIYKAFHSQRDERAKTKRQAILEKWSCS